MHISETSTPEIVRALCPSTPPFVQLFADIDWAFCPKVEKMHKLISQKTAESLHARAHHQKDAPYIAFQIRGQKVYVSKFALFATYASIRVTEKWNEREWEKDTNRENANKTLREWEKERERERKWENAKLR